MRFCLCIIQLASLLLLMTESAGCVKEYSYEGSDSTVIKDSVPPDSVAADTALVVAPCFACNEVAGDNEWLLQINDSKHCGIIDTAIVSRSRDALTFFGPSHCSIDSGLIISVWLQPTQALDKDWKNLQAGFASFYYYDNVGGGYMLQSRSALPVNLVITDYNHSTKKAEGTFSGAVFTKGGRQVIVQGGKWKTWLK